MTSGPTAPTRDVRKSYSGVGNSKSYSGVCQHESSLAEVAEKQNFQGVTLKLRRMSDCFRNFHR